MIPKAAIEKAIEGGWNSPKSGSLADMIWETTALDPTFWQALGKSLGWPTGKEPDVSLFEWETKGWSGRAHQFFDLILTGQDTAAFWDELLTNNK